jgi:hypothetical protein
MSAFRGPVVALMMVLGPTLLLGQGLAPSVQADLLRNQIYAQAKANDADSILKSLDQYHKLVEDNKLDFPVPLYWIEAKAAHDTGDTARALNSLTQFLNKADHGSAEYKEGLALYPVYQDAVGKSLALARDAKRAALITRVPEVIESMRKSLKEIPEGQFSSPAKNFEWNRTIDGHYGRLFTFSVKVPRFLMTSCITLEAWKAFIADTGRGDVELRDGDSTCSPPETLAFEPHDWPSQSDLQAFAAWISAHDGGKWRMPNTSELGLLKEQEAALYPLVVELAPGFYKQLRRPPTDRLTFNFLNECDDIGDSCIHPDERNVYAVAVCWTEEKGEPDSLDPSMGCERKEIAYMGFSFYFPEVKAGREYTIIRPDARSWGWGFDRLRVLLVRED